MNKRLQQFLAAENISQSQFAESINVARASVSHILSGRNKPSFDFIESVMLHYPSINPEWLITGKGKMYSSSTSSSSSYSGDLFDQPKETPPSTEQNAGNTEQQTGEIESIASTYSAQRAVKELVSAKNKSIIKVIIYYSDYSYTEIV